MRTDWKTVAFLMIVIITFLTGFSLRPVIFPVTTHRDKHGVFTDKAPQPIGPYSQAIRSGDYVFISGQIGIDPATGNLTADVDGQTTRAMENIGAILNAAGLDFSDVIQCRIYLTDLQDFTTVNGSYQDYFRSNPPARATVQVSALPRWAKVEIEMVAKRR